MHVLHSLPSSVTFDKVLPRGPGRAPVELARPKFSMTMYPRATSLWARTRVVAGRAKSSAIELVA